MRVAGVDEAGRGPLAGPVVAAAVILDPDRPIAGLADSKALAPELRARLGQEVRQRALAWSVALASPAEIDTLNILQATLLAMRRALAGLVVAPDHVEIDGNRLPRLEGVVWARGAPAPSVETVVRGDASRQAISAASILAKTLRDAYMEQLIRDILDMVSRSTRATRPPRTSRPCAPKASRPCTAGVSAR
jgi:ribonuclease HII